MKIHLLLVLALVGTAKAANYPFPYFADYPQAKAATFSSSYSSLDIQTLYQAWKSTYYEECSNGKGARIKWADSKASGTCNSSGNCTVSEGIGYGMLITVYMDNSTNNTKAMFDKLWTYYNSFLDDKGLMDWKISGCDSKVEGGAATDAEMDVALALAMAYKQWGDATYLTNLKSLLAKIWANEVDKSAFLLYPGSQFTTPYNPSYASIGALRVFATLDTGHEWAKVADNLMAMLTKNANATTGLPSDWCATSGNFSPTDFKSSGTDKFGYDAARTPWRVAMSYIWYGGASEKAWLSKINTWIQTKAGTSWAKVYAEWKLDGSGSATFFNSLYYGAFAVTGFVDAADSAWMRKGMQEILSLGSDYYYNDSWQLLYALTLSGNFQNFAGTVKPVGVEARTPEIASWSVARTARGIELRGKGVAQAELRDLHGRLLQSVSGEGTVVFDRPAARGLYLVRVHGVSSALPVMVD